MKRRRGPGGDFDGSSLWKRSYQHQRDSPLNQNCTYAHLCETSQSIYPIKAAPTEVLPSSMRQFRGMCSGLRGSFKVSIRATAARGKLIHLITTHPCIDVNRTTLHTVGARHCQILVSTPNTGSKTVIRIVCNVDHFVNRGFLCPL
jgi:hypothetical protein